MKSWMRPTPGLSYAAKYPLSGPTLSPQYPQMYVRGVMLPWMFCHSKTTLPSVAMARTHVVAATRTAVLVSGGADFRIRVMAAFAAGSLSESRFPGKSGSHAALPTVAASRLYEEGLCVKEPLVLWVLCLGRMWRWARMHRPSTRRCQSG